MQMVLNPPMQLSISSTCEFNFLSNSLESKDPIYLMW